jgi:hypothetical protein
MRDYPKICEWFGCITGGTLKSLESLRDPQENQPDKRRFKTDRILRPNPRSETTAFCYL